MNNIIPVSIALLGATIEFERIAVTAFKTSPEQESVVESGTVARVKTFLCMRVKANLYIFLIKSAFHVTLWNTV